MKLVKHICISQKEADAIQNFLEFLEVLDDDCYDEFVRQIGCPQDFYINFSNFLENVDVDPWEK